MGCRPGGPVAILAQVILAQAILPRTSSLAKASLQRNETLDTMSGLTLAAIVAWAVVQGVQADTCSDNQAGYLLKSAVSAKICTSNTNCKNICCEADATKCMKYVSTITCATGQNIPAANYG